MEVHSENARAIFFDAIENYRPEEWPDLLNSVCGTDLELRSSVEKLLRAYDPSGPFMAAVAADQLDVTMNCPQPSSRESGVGTIIGRYKLLEQIGEGGMGSVYMASQSRPIQRKVALKIIKAGMDSKEVITRFEAERQALALMNHPNIARVLDGGTTENGRPYFVMELVRGTPITEFCDRQKLGTRERLQLLICVCDAVQHAHQKGIIHRDLKPSNILVELHDVKPVPKVIDFGISKAIGQQLTENTLYTGFHEMVGTPLYMSPEQAGQSSLDVDTRSDVYSLGVLLYELLTGQTPFSRETIRQAGYEELRKMIREVEPPSPSARVSTLENAARSTLSDQRQIDPAKLSIELRGELDWITMKAIEKDRTRRYETPSALAADLQRFLNDEPVLACPPSAAYRLRKAARKHRLGISVVFSIGVAILIGASLAVWQAARATRAEREATAYFTKSLNAIDLMLNKVGDKELIDVPAMSPVRYAVIQDAVKLYLDLLQTAEQDPRVIIATASALRRLSTEELHLDQFAEGESSIRRSLTVLAQLQSSDRNTTAALQEIGDCYQTLGNILNRQGRHAEAIEAFQNSLQAFDALPPSVADRLELSAGTRMLSAQSLFRQGKFTEAQQLLTETLPIHTEAFRRSSGYWWPLAVNLEWLGQLAEQHGDHQAALEFAQRSFETAEQFRLDLSSGNIPDDVSAEKSGGLKTVLYFKALAAGRIGHIQRLLNMPKESEQSFLQMYSLCNTLVETYPEVPGFRDQQRVAMENLPSELRGETLAERRERLRKFRNLKLSHANEYIVRGQLAESMGDIDLALSDFKQAADLEPDNSDIQLTYVFCLQNRRGDVPSALLYTESLLQKYPQKVIYLIVAARLDLVLGNQERSLERYRKATELDPNLGDAWSELAEALQKSGDSAGATAAMERAIRCSQTSFRVWESYGSQLRSQGQTQGALEAYTKALEIAPNQWWIRKRRAGCLVELNKHLAAIDDLKLALEEHPEDLTTLTWLPLDVWTNCTDSAVRERLIALADRAVYLNSDSPDSLVVRAVLHTAIRDFETSDRDFQRAIKLEPENPIRRYSMALVQLATGRISEYQQTTDTLITMALQNPTPETLYWSCWTCALSETTPTGSEPLLKATAEHLTKTPGDLKLRSAMTALQVQSGRYEEAKTQLLAAQQSAADEFAPEYVSLFLALVLAHQGQSEQAQALLTEVAAKITTMDAQGEFLSWNRRLTFQLLMKQGTRLLADPQK